MIRHIEYLISRNDCVIIPDFGAILAKNIPASYDAELGVFNPPSRVYSFNRDLRHSDGLLLASVQRAECLSYENAAYKVKAAVEALNAQLRYSGEVALGRIGKVTLDARTGTMAFVPNVDNPLCHTSLWLNPIRVKPLAVDTPNIAEAPIQKRPAYTFKRFIRAAASIAILLCIGFIASTPVTVDDAMLASLAPEVTQISPEEMVPQREVEATLRVVLPQPGEDSRISSAKPQASPMPTAGVDNECLQQVMHYVVVATFVAKTDAERFIDMQTDRNLRLLERGKYIRVYTSAHTDAQDAYQACKIAAKTYPDAWVCKK